MLLKAVIRLEQAESSFAFSFVILVMSGFTEGEFDRSASRLYLSVAATRAWWRVWLLSRCCWSFIFLYSAWRLDRSAGMLLPSRVCGRFVGAILVIKKMS